ncbi:hypothetical protein GCM10027406_34680 [Leifsonia lichenia]
MTSPVEPGPGTARWNVVLPLKEPQQGKTRLTGRSAALAEAIAVDTVSAVVAASTVAHAVVVTDWAGAGVALSGLAAPGRIVIVPGAPEGLNPAVRFGLLYCRSRWPGSPVAMMVADLPCLDSSELDAVLERAEGIALAAVADSDDVGTVLITAQPESDVSPAFGGASFQRHRDLGHIDLTPFAGPTLRRDIDGWDHLARAGLTGARTSVQLALLAATSGARF